MCGFPPTPPPPQYHTPPPHAPDAQNTLGSARRQHRRCQAAQTRLVYSVGTRGARGGVRGGARCGPKRRQLRQTCEEHRPLAAAARHASLAASRIADAVGLRGRGARSVGARVHRARWADHARETHQATLQAQSAPGGGRIHLLVLLVVVRHEAAFHRHAPVLRRELPTRGISGVKRGATSARL